MLLVVKGGQGTHAVPKGGVSGDIADPLSGNPDLCRVFRQKFDVLLTRSCGHLQPPSEIGASLAVAKWSVKIGDAHCPFGLLNENCCSTL